METVSTWICGKVYAGIQALKGDGNAAAASGSVVSYAGIFTMLHYNAKDHKVDSIDAGYNSYLHETDP